MIRATGARCSVLRSDPPLTFRETADGLTWVGSAAGPVGSDDLALVVVVDDGSQLSLSSVAASLAHPGPAGAPSTFRVDVRIGAGASLRWQPRPTVLIRGCDHRVDVSVELAAGSTLTWRDEVVLGRHDEASGSLFQRLVVDVGGRPLLRTELAVGPRWPGSEGPAGTDGARSVGTLLVVGQPPPKAAPPAGVRAAFQPLGPGAVLVTALGQTGGGLTAWLDALASPYSARRMMASP